MNDNAHFKHSKECANRAEALKIKTVDKYSKYIIYKNAPPGQKEDLPLWDDIILGDLCEKTIVIIIT